MSTHNICLHREIMKIFSGHLLSGVMCNIMNIPAKIEISLHICAVQSEPSMGTCWTPKDALFMQTPKTDQTAQMHKLI